MADQKLGAGAGAELVLPGSGGKHRHLGAVGTSPPVVLHADRVGHLGAAAGGQSGERPS